MPARSLSLYFFFPYTQCKRVNFTLFKFENARRQQGVQAIFENLTIISVKVKVLTGEDKDQMGVGREFVVDVQIVDARFKT